MSDKPYRLFAEKDVPLYMSRFRAYEGDPTTRDALALLTLTAVRPGDVRGAEWTKIDEGRAIWRIPAERMKMKTEHSVLLSTQALAVLRQLRPLTCSGGWSSLHRSTRTSR